ncbi:MAG: AAA family ATPase [Acidimicrobiia bacterium]|nr:AAA family ATPase [Acidimicrobiia bacterium]
MVEHGRLRTQERKVATVLFVDLAESTSLGERLDIEPLAQVMGGFHRAVREAVEQREGTAEFVGDGVVAIFGAPVAVENHQGRALEAADAILDAIDGLNRRLAPGLGAELGVRIGVNTGDVLVDHAGDTGVGGMASDVFNVAARLERTAGVGEIVVSERTLGAIHDRAVFDLGERPIAGREHPVRAFRVGRAGSAGSDLGSPLRLVGREAEMEALTAALDELLDTGESGICTIVGEAGIGKSALFDAFIDDVKMRTPMPVARSDCRAFGDSGSLAPVAALLESALGEPPTRHRIAELLLGDPEHHVDVLTRAFGLVDGEREPGSAPGRAAHDLAAAWRAVVSKLTSDEPWLFAIEDIHWMEPEALELIRAIVDARGEGALVVATARPGRFAEVWPIDGESCRLVELEPLDEAGTEAVAISVDPGVGASPGVASALFRVTDGNPFFTVELTRSISEAGKASGFSLDDLEQLGVPDSVQAVIADRIDRLDPQAKRVLQIASMVGREFFAAPIAAVLDLEPSTLESALERLRLRGMVEPTRDPMMPFRFVHALTRDVAHRSIPRRDLHGLHETVADWVESHADVVPGDMSAIIAFHLEQAYSALAADWEATPEHAATVRRRWVSWAIKAARRAIAATAFTEGKRLAELAVENAADDEQRVSALECLGNAHFYSYEGDQAWSVLTRAADLAAETGVRRLSDVATLYIRALASTVRWAGGVRHPPIPQELRARISRAGELLGPGDSVERVQLLTVVGFWPFATVGHPDTDLITEVEARTAALEAADMARRLGRVDLESAALDGLGSTHIFRGDYRAADEVTRRRCDLYESLADPWERGDLCAVAGWVAFQRGRYDESIRWATRGIENAGDDYPSVALHCRTWRGLARFRSGDWFGVLEDLAAVEAEAIGGVAPYTTPLVAAAALVHHLRGDDDETDRLLAALVPSDEPEGPELSRWAEFVAPIFARRGDAETALEMIDCTAHRRASRQGQLLIARCQVMIEARRWDRFGAFAGHCRRLAEQHGLEALLPAVEVAEAWCAFDTGEIEIALEQFEAGRAVADRMGDPWWTGTADLGLAAASARLGLDDRAVHHRARAIETFDRLGAVRELERAAAVTTG